MNRTTSGIVLSEFVLSGDPLYFKSHLLPWVSVGIHGRTILVVALLFDEKKIKLSSASADY